MKKVLLFSVLFILYSMALADEKSKVNRGIIKTNKDSNGVVLEVEMEKKVYKSRENIDIKITIINNSSNEIVIQFASLYYMYAYFYLKKDGKDFGSLGTTLFGKKVLGDAFAKANEKK